MTFRKRTALVGFVAGLLIALVMLVIVKIATGGHPKLWARAVDLSVIVFPSHVFLLPLSDSESFPHDLLLYFVAILGNGVIYSLAIQIVAALYFIARKVVGHFVWQSRRTMLERNACVSNDPTGCTDPS